MGVPVLIGVCQSQGGNEPPKTFTIGTINTVTIGYGTTTGSQINAIPASEQIATTLNSSNSFTFPTDSLAQYYSNSNPDEQVFTAFTVSWNPDNFTQDDLPSDGENEVQWKFTNFNPSPPNTGIWFLEGDNTTGEIVPQGAKIAGVNVVSAPVFNRNQVAPTTPVFGDVTTGGAGCQAFVIRSNGMQMNNNTDRISKLALASTASIDSTQFLLTIRIKLKGGDYAEGSQTITIPSEAIKTNLVGTIVKPVVAQVRTQAILSTPLDSTEPGTVLPEENQIVAVINGDNGWQAPSFEATGQGMIYLTDTDKSASHSLRVDYDTSGLTPSDFPEEMNIRYVITADGFDASEIGFLTEDFFGFVALFTGLNRDEYITGDIDVGPLVLLESPSQFKIDDGLNLETWKIRIGLQKNDGSYLESDDQTITMAVDTVINL